MNNNKNEVAEMISDKNAEARAKEMGKSVCSEKHTLAQSIAEINKAFKEQGPYVNVTIDGVHYSGNVKSLKRLIEIQENRKKDVEEELAM